MSYTPYPGQFTTPQEQFTPPFMQAPLGNETLGIEHDGRPQKYKNVSSENRKCGKDGKLNKLQNLAQKYQPLTIESRKSKKVAHTSVINLKANLQNLKLPKIPSKLCTNLQGQLKSLEAKHKSFNDRVLDGGVRDTVGENIILYGIPEQQQGTEHNHGADNSDVFANEFITKRLGLAGGDMVLDRAHRLGHPEKPTCQGRSSSNFIDTKIEKKQTNLFICNGRLNQDRDVNVNGESVVDYCFSNPDGHGRQVTLIPS